VERRLPAIATTAWWKEERRGVFVDYNQNARDRTIASVYSVRPVADATVSFPLAWDDIDTSVDPGDFHIDNVPELFKQRDAGEGIDRASGALESLLELADRDEKEGLGDAPWPPHFPKAEGEPARVQPSRRRKA
jgi:bifunctional non-homologous end joining protein LigD